jgi:hypothetical protein
LQTEFEDILHKRSLFLNDKHLIFLVSVLFVNFIAQKEFKMKKWEEQRRMKNYQKKIKNAKSTISITF